ncbi:MAG: 3-methyl-2-oxobutanoate hydroxymethyltransferase [Spirochaetales bacterium]|nr:3-methyl-2-oxobutanoate hydroxymethyltransferase [Spirochaetales bacterium]
MDTTFSKSKSKKISMITCYDFQTAQIAAKTEVDVLLVGDSLGMVFQGKESTREVTIEQMIYHTECVRRGAPEKIITTDLPLHTSLDPQKAVDASRRLIEAGATNVKIEGNNREILTALAERKIPFVGHAGLLPQSATDYKPKGRGEDRQVVLQQSLDIQEFGASMIVLECIPEELAKEITQRLEIPTIGIGAGRFCDGQVLVINDLLGLGRKVPKFVKKYANLEEIIYNAINNYILEIEKGVFPGQENIYK